MDTVKLSVDGIAVPEIREYVMSHTKDEYLGDMMRACEAADRMVRSLERELGEVRHALAVCGCSVRVTMTDRSGVRLYDALVGCPESRPGNVYKFPAEAGSGER